MNGVNRFNFYKISVELAVNLNLFTQKKPKHEIVAAAFNMEEPVLAKHKGVLIGYVKFKRVGDYIIGSLGKQTQAELSGPPSTGFKPKIQEEWPHILVIINVSPDQPYGQTIAVQKDDHIFREPIQQLRSLLDEVSMHNTILDGYELVLNSVSTKESFWDIVKSREGKIQRLTFNLAAPNFLGLNDEVSEGMKALQSKYNATEAELSIKNPVGSLEIPENDNFVDSAVNYATKGAGDIKLKVKDEGVVDAKKHKVTATITTEDVDIVVESEDTEKVKAICDKLFLCLKDLD